MRRACPYNGSMNSSASAFHDSQHASPARHNLYQVRLAGNLDTSWQEWFDDMHLSYDAPRDETLLTGTFADQAALHGFLAKIRDLDLELIALQRLESNPASS